MLINFEEITDKNQKQRNNTYKETINSDGQKFYQYAMY